MGCICAIPYRYKNWCSAWWQGTLCRSIWCSRWYTWNSAWLCSGSFICSIYLCHLYEGVQEADEKRTKCQGELIWLHNEDSCNYGYSGPFKYYYIQYQWYYRPGYFQAGCTASGIHSEWYRRMVGCIHRKVQAFNQCAYIHSISYGSILCAGAYRRISQGWYESSERTD